MRSLSRFIATASLGSLALLFGAVGAAHAEVGHNAAAPQAVYIQTNDPSGNSVIVYNRNDDGTLTQAGSYATGGNGGKQTGAVVDPLASQGSLAYDADAHLLLVTNGGSDTVSVFGVDGSSLTLRQVVSSGGAFPSSIGVHGDLAYVLDTGKDANVAGYRIAGGQLHPIAGSSRALGISNDNPPAFLASPGQVGFTPDGAHVVVTTKATGTIDVFAVGADGRLSAVTSNPPAGQVPFAFSFDAAGHLVVVEAMTNSVSTYTVNADNTITTVSGPVTDGQAAACWIAGAGNGTFYVANAGSGTLSRFAVDGAGTVTLASGTTPTAGGPIDLAISSDGHFVYSENGGAGTIDEFRVEADGSLTAIGQIKGLAAHVIEGITAS
jgi:6-phosphogluconolactonase (cycloisomerase 2 family)